MRKPYLPSNIRIKESMSLKFKIAMVVTAIIVSFLIGYV